MNEDILCARTHEWVKENDDNTISIGITDIKTNELGDIVFIELPETDSYFVKDEIFATIESVKMASELYMPVSGKIVDVNIQLIKTPELINDNPFDNWLIKVEADNFQQDCETLVEYQDYVE